MVAGIEESQAELGRRLDTSPGATGHHGREAIWPDVGFRKAPSGNVEAGWWQLVRLWGGGTYPSLRENQPPEWRYGLNCVP